MRQDERNIKLDVKDLADRAFSIIEMVEVAGLKDTSFKLIRKKLLDLGNDILRLVEPNER